VNATRSGIEDQLNILCRGTVEVLPLEDLRAKLERSFRENRPLRVKQGFDPTAPDIHLGHAVGLRKLRQFQELGHTVVLIIGDYTGLIGDPSGQSKTRPQLTAEQLEENALTYLEQFGRIVDLSRAEVRRNGEWFARMHLSDVIRLAAKVTVARITERDDFTERLRANQPVGLHELLYPLMQAYDSVAINADVELGATEQKFNLLTGRTLQTEYGQEPQVVMTLPILPGLDGVRRMSKSLGNYIGVTESPREMYGKLMSIPDGAIAQYLRLAADCDAEEVAKAEQAIATRSVNPMEWKRRLAQMIVSIYHNQDAACLAAEEFTRQFSRGEIPADAPTVVYVWQARPDGMRDVKELLTATGLVATRSEALRLIQSGAVSIDGARLASPFFSEPISDEFHVRVGRKYVRVVPSSSAV
jgi:tyrosyl-tRNA synthetase